MSATPQKKGSSPPEIRNAKAFHRYFVEERLEAGIVLKGTEIKSIRQGKAQITEAFVRFDQNIPILYHAHIDEYAFGNTNNHNPTRPRKLLLHHREIRRLRAAIETGGASVVPLRIYFKRGLAKVEIALCKGKKLYDKRDVLKKKTMLREAERTLQRHR